jgi:hypothetical protein
MKEFVLAFATSILLIACTSINPAEFKARQIAAETISPYVHAGNNLPHVIKQTTLVNESVDAYLFKICDTDIFCSCNQNYYIVKIEKSNFTATIVEERPCFLA